MAENSREGSALAALGALLLLVPVAVVALVLGRNSAGAAATPSTPVTIYLGREGGFRGEGAWIEPPLLWLTGDRLYRPVPGSTSARVADVDHATAVSWAASLRRAGVGTRTRWGDAVSAHVTNLELQLTDAHGRATAGFGGGLDDDPTQPSSVLPMEPQYVAARAPVRAVVAAMQAWLDEHGARYTPPEVLVLAQQVTPLAAQTDAPTPPPEVVTPWPGSHLAGGTPIPEPLYDVVWHCHRLDAAETASVLPVVTRATGDVRWQADGGRWVVRLVPAFPGRDCSNLPPVTTR